SEALEGLADPLVRESIQNSLDAAIDDVVHVRFAFGTLESAAVAPYLDSLWPHLQAVAGDEIRPPRRDEPFTFLVIEDFGTRGLEGDPEQYEDSFANDRN